MSSTDWTAVPSSLAAASVDRGVIHVSDPPAQGGLFVFGFHTLVNGVPGVVAFRSTVTDFVPTSLGATIRAAMKRGLAAIASGFAPFLFVGLDTDNVSGTCYVIGLEDAQPARILVRRGVLSDGLLANGRLVTGNTEPFVLADLQPLTVSVDGGTDQTITFNTAQFVDIALATAAEVAAEMNLGLTGASAVPDVTTGAVILTSDGDASKVEVTGGTAAAALAFPSGVSGIVIVGTETFNRDTWVHLRIDAVENAGTIELDAFRNDLSKQPLNIPADWETPAGMAQFVDPSATALVGGFGGYAFRTEDKLGKFVLFDQVEFFRDLI